MKQQPCGQAIADRRPAERFRWRGAALRALVETKACQSTSKQGSLDASLQAYFRAKKSSEHISLDLAKGYLSDELTTPIRRVRDENERWTEETYAELLMRSPWPNTDPALRQAFHDNIGSKNWLARQRQAFMKLYDPTKPTAEPFLQYCDRIAARGERTRGSKECKAIIIRRLYKQCVDARIILRHQELSGDSSWLSEFSRSPRSRGARMIAPRYKSSEKLKEIYTKSGWQVGWW